MTDAPLVLAHLLMAASELLEASVSVVDVYREEVNLGGLDGKHCDVNPCEHSSPLF